MRIISWFAMVCFPPKISYSVCLVSGYGRTSLFTPPCVSFQPMKNGRRKADPFHLAQRYTQAQTDAVQPPDDRTYSAEVTSFPSNLLHHRSARFSFPEKFANFPYTRSIMIPPFFPFVKHYFCNFFKKYPLFFQFYQKPFLLLVTKNE